MAKESGDASRGSSYVCGAVADRELVHCGAVRWRPSLVPVQGVEGFDGILGIICFYRVTDEQIET